MRNYLSVSSSFLLLFVTLSCGGPKADPLVISAETKIDVTADGLSVIAITLDPNDGTLAEHLQLFGETIEDNELASKLLLDGIHIRRIHTSELQALKSSIGETLEEDFVWHGQMMNWRDIHQRPIPSGGILLTKDGVSYFVHSGFLSLLARSWLVEREDGVSLYLQVLPTWHIPSRHVSVIGQASKPARSNIFSNIKIETLLKDEEAILLGVALSADTAVVGPSDDGPAAVRLGEALMGAPVSEDIILLLVLQANLQSWD